MKTHLGAAALSLLVSLPACSDVPGEAGSPAATFRLVDDFERENSQALAPPWVDCKSLRPANFEPLGVFDGGVVVADLMTREGEYDGIPHTGNPPKDGRFYPGIGCAAVDTGTTTVSIRLTWNGHFGKGKPNREEDNIHVEATPLLYVSPETSRFGFGAWTTTLHGSAVLMLGYIGSPPELFEPLGVALLPEKHKAGETFEYELRADRPGEVTLWYKGEQLGLYPDNSLDPVIVDPELASSTWHGFALDAHLVHPVERGPTIKGVEAISIVGLPVKAGDE
jgi:hypothetical protein